MGSHGNGDYPEWEFGVQIVEEEDEHKFDFDLLDPTKIIPEELVPVKRIGKLTLNRNPDNFFAETEQVAFHPDTSRRESILPTILCFRGVCFLIRTLNCYGWGSNFHDSDQPSRGGGS
jgi:hypothetical protein